MELSFESLGSAAGSALPIPFGSQLGTLAGNLLGGISSKFMGGGTKTAAGAFAGKHSMYTENLDDSQVNTPDAATYLGLAKRFNISVEEVAIVMAADADMNGISAQQCWDGYAAGTSTGLDYYFSKVQGARIASGMLGPIAPAGAMLRALANYQGKAKFIQLRVLDDSQTATAPAELIPTSARSSAQRIEQTMLVPTSMRAAGMQQNLTGDDLKKIAQGGLEGLRKGVTDEVMKTKEGREAQNAGAKQWLNDNGLIIGGVFAVLLSFITFLIATRKK